MKHIHIAKRRPRPASRRQEPLPLDTRDPDIVKAHQLARSSGSQGPADGGRVEATQDPAGPRRTGVYQALRLVIRTD